MKTLTGSSALFLLVATPQLGMAAPPVITETLPAPKVELTVATVSSKRWTMRLENTGDVPLRIVADPYLLSLEVAVPAGPAPAKGKKPSPARTVRCALPADMRPSGDLARGVVLPPGKAYKESFDPRMYCFGAKESGALVRGARVIAHYGFTPPRASKKPPQAPFVIVPIAQAVGEGAKEPPAKVASLKEVIVSSAIELSEEAISREDVAAPTTTPVSPATDGIETSLAITLPARSDGARARDLSLNVTLANIGPRKTSVYFRPQSVAFDVTGPGGEFACPANGAGAIRELFTTLSPRGKASTQVLVAASCPDRSFDLPGLYEVRPRLDTRGIIGSPAGLHAFEGEALGPPSLVRIRLGKQGVLRPPPMIE